MLLARIYYAIHDTLFSLLKHFDGLGPLLLRLILAPVMLSAGLHKWHNFDDIVSWFGNAEWGLGLPQPELMATLATATEIVGGLLLLFGLAVRWAAIPLMVTMLVAALTVHWEHGWFAVAPSNPATSTAKVLADVGVPAAQRSLDNSVEVGKRLDKARGLLQEHGNYQWLTEKGAFVVLNNGIEFAATYFVMLLVLLFTGGGRYVSLDYYLDRHFRRQLALRRSVAAPVEPVWQPESMVESSQPAPDPIAETPVPQIKKEAEVAKEEVVPEEVAPSAVQEKAPEPEEPAPEPEAKAHEPEKKAPELETKAPEPEIPTQEAADKAAEVSESDDEDGDDDGLDDGERSAARRRRRRARHR